MAVNVTIGAPDVERVMREIAMENAGLRASIAAYIRTIGELEVHISELTPEDAEQETKPKKGK